MKGKRPLSAGTLFMLGLTAIITVGSLFVLKKMRNDISLIQLPEKIMDVSQLTFSASATPVPKSTDLPVIEQILPATDGGNRTAVPVSEQTPTPSPTAVQSTKTQSPARSFSLTVSGIAAFDKDITEACLTQDKSDVDYSGIFDDISEYLVSDLNVCPVGGLFVGSAKNYSDLIYPTSAAKALGQAGFDSLLMNFSKALDKGLDPLTESVNITNQSNLTSFGTGVSGSGDKIIQLNGIKIAMLGYVSTASSKTKSAMKTYPDALNSLDTDAIGQDIQQVRQAGAEVVIVCVCWGKTDAEKITASQRSTAQALAGAGADLIIGFNPSGVLGVEYVQGENGHTALVAYSMGSLLCADRSAGRNVAGMLLQLNINVQNETVSFSKIDYVPLYQWRQKINGKITYKVVVASAAVPEGMEQKQQGYMSNALTRINKLMTSAPLTR